MAEGKANQRPSRRRQIALGGLIWVGCFVTGIFVTSILRERAVRDLPRTEIFEAMHRDSVAIQYSLAGYAISLMISLLAAVIVARPRG